MSVGRICSRNLDTVQLNDAVSVAAQRMLARNVGTLVVVDKDHRPLGIVTDRDLAIRILAECRDPSRANVWEVMSVLPQTVAEETPIEDVLGMMRGGPFRRLPVVDHENRLVGLISVDDILNLLAAEFGEISKLVRRESPESLATV